MNLCDLTVITALLKKHGFHFSKALGQNFLIDPEVPERIAEASGIARDNGVLEIGPGVGSLTSELAKSAGFVAAVELDRRLLPVLSESLSGCGNVEVISGDIMKLDLSELITNRFNGLRPVVCANLPYGITTPVLSRLIDSHLFETITVMVQREVALRICAAPGIADYGAFSVYAQYHTEPEILFDVQADAFFPKPKVCSSVVKLAVKREKPAEVHDAALFFRVVKAAFAQRRKTLPNALFAAFGSDYSKEELSRAVESAGHDARIRGEALSISEFATITDFIGNLSVNRKNIDVL